MEITHLQPIIRKTLLSKITQQKHTPHNYRRLISGPNSILSVRLLEHPLSTVIEDHCRRFNINTYDAVSSCYSS